MDIQSQAAAILKRGIKKSLYHQKSNTAKAAQYQLDQSRNVSCRFTDCGGDVTNGVLKYGKEKTTNQEVSACLAKPEIAKMFDGYDGEGMVPEDVLFNDMREEGVQPEHVKDYDFYVSEDYPPGLVDRYKAYLAANPM